MKKKDDSLDLCSIKTFAEMSGVSAEEACKWVAYGTVPSARLFAFGMIDLGLPACRSEQRRNGLQHGGLQPCLSTRWS